MYEHRKSRFCKLHQAPPDAHHGSLCFRLSCKLLSKLNQSDLTPRESESSTSVHLGTWFAQPARLTLEVKLASHKYTFPRVGTARQKCIDLRRATWRLLRPQKLKSAAQSLQRVCCPQAPQSEAADQNVCKMILSELRRKQRAELLWKFES